MKNKVTSDMNGASRNEIEEMVREEFEEKQCIKEIQLDVMCFGFEEGSSIYIY